MPSRHRGRRLAGRTLLALLFSWSVAALWLDPGPLPMRFTAAALYLAITVAFLWWRTKAATRLLLWVAINALVIARYATVRPPADQDWSPEFAQAPWAGRTGDQITIHAVRNFSYRTEKDFDARWETRTVDLRQVVGADLFLTHWGVPFIAHSMVSFRFADGSYLATSIEARRNRTQEFSAGRGFFRQYQVLYLIADERDVVRVRTNYRKDEEVYLYRTRLGSADARALFEAYLGWMNATHDRPEWYNALTRNCSTPVTTYLARARVGGISRWDWRGVLDGSADKMLYELGDLAGDNLPFATLKLQAHINPAAQAADRLPEFSQAIRAGRAGFDR